MLIPSAFFYFTVLFSMELVFLNPQILGHLEIEKRVLATKFGVLISKSEWIPWTSSGVEV